MSLSHDSHQGGAGTKSVAWVVVLVVILLALLVFPEGGRVTVNGQERNAAEAAAASTVPSEPEHETAAQAP